MRRPSIDRRRSSAGSRPLVIEVEVAENGAEGALLERGDDRVEVDRFDAFARLRPGLQLTIGVEGVALGIDTPAWNSATTDFASGMRRGSGGKVTSVPCASTASLTVGS